jgi:hypothetical protein
MPTVISHEVSEGGWGCNCLSFRRRVPQKFLVDTMARASDVTVVKQWSAPADEHFSMAHQWSAWTREDEAYTVFYDPSREGGWCKHIAACAAELVGGQMGETYQAVKEMRAECHMLRKEVKRQAGLVGRLKISLEKAKSKPKATSL